MECLHDIDPGVLRTELSSWFVPSVTCSPFLLVEEGAGDRIRGAREPAFSCRAPHVGSLVERGVSCDEGDDFIAI